MTAFIDEHRDVFGVLSVCRVLSEHGATIAPSGYYAHKKRGPSRRALHDAALAETIEATFFDRDKGRGLYGARKMWHQLRRDGVTGQGGEPVARCTVERLMRELGLRGVRRGQPTITTRPDQHAGRAPDLVDRDFTAARPNQLWVVDLTYVPTWSGTVFTAFVSDVYSRRIVGWRCAARVPTELPLDALEMALWTRGCMGQQGGIWRQVGARVGMAMVSIQRASSSHAAAASWADSRAHTTGPAPSRSGGPGAVAAASSSIWGASSAKTAACSRLY